MVECFRHIGFSVYNFFLYEMLPIVQQEVTYRDNSLQKFSIFFLLLMVQSIEITWQENVNGKIFSFENSFISNSPECLNMNSDISFYYFCLRFLLFRFDKSFEVIIPCQYDWKITPFSSPTVRPGLWMAPFPFTHQSST